MSQVTLLKLLSATIQSGQDAKVSLFPSDAGLIVFPGLILKICDVCVYVCVGVVVCVVWCGVSGWYVICVWCVCVVTVYMYVCIWVWCGVYMHGVGCVHACKVICVWCVCGMVTVYMYVCGMYVVWYVCIYVCGVVWGVCMCERCVVCL